MAVETSPGVHDRFNWLNIVCWASCFFRMLHIIYVSVLVMSISPCSSSCFVHPFLSHSFLLCLFSSLIRSTVTFSLVFIPLILSSFLSLFSHLYYHLHFLTIHFSSFLSSLQITVKSHTVTHTQQCIYTHIQHTLGFIINVLTAVIYTNQA